MDIEKKRKEILFSREDIQRKVEELGRQITKDYQGKKLLVVSLLKGSFIFTADLVREIKIPTKIEFMATSSYGHSTESSGKVQILYDIKGDIEGYDILIADDIADTGITMKYVINYLKSKNPKSIKSCVLLDKPSRRKVELKADYVGFTIPDKFIVGYGLNYGDYYRNVPYVFSFVD
ncbi:hypoxanthine phosphoribosyltransferase [Paramaledivibacter caminithermalis]|jgi:hypoxanthine phosphoribosyltransferase|uniref:Hypoxanthine phosphoribosyltransferase n=1 Tax=Paramaledivibacter caminithermalis (strain DSM 15212 / CIP 107654 / DViRD3) TaxID=1121301 RepID=A0A1M6PZJ4_PARC5|nr:hypoxanthine phosphoribosyltransferase [Paramaledivibacter caminithermalis]SHK13369.1 hypoxanthine phosphoribosyltransferase [Paramaledivibacter caminithermalis DSM 15212]